MDTQTWASGSIAVLEEIRPTEPSIRSRLLNCCVTERNEQVHVALRRLLEHIQARAANVEVGV
jgi:hypothetical protein